MTRAASRGLAVAYPGCRVLQDIYQDPFGSCIVNRSARVPNQIQCKAPREHVYLLNQSCRLLSQS